MLNTEHNNNPRPENISERGPISYQTPLLYFLSRYNLFDISFNHKSHVGTDSIFHTQDTFFCNHHSKQSSLFFQTYWQVMGSLFLQEWLWADQVPKSLWDTVKNAFPVCVKCTAWPERMHWMTDHRLTSITNRWNISKNKLCNFPLE